MYRLCYSLLFCFDLRVVFVICSCSVLVYYISVDVGVVFACVFAVFPSEGG